MSDCIFDNAAMIAAVSMPNCPCACFGMMSRTQRAAPPILRTGDLYQGRFKTSVSVSLTIAGFTASDADSLFHQKNGLRKNGLRTLSRLLFGSVMAVLLIWSASR